MFLLRFVYILIPFTLLSCEIFKSSNKFDVKLMSSKFDLSSQSIDTLIRLDGYFFNNRCTGMSSLDEGSIIFFNDGSCSCLTWNDEPPIFAGISNINLKEHLGKYDERILPLGFKLTHYDLCGGSYQINGDTIIVEYLNSEYPYLLLNTITFVVVDRETLIMLNKVVTNKDANIQRSHDIIEGNRLIWKFVAASNLPSPINMYNKNIKKRWSNNEKWKEYKRQRKYYLKK